MSETPGYSRLKNSERYSSKDAKLLGPAADLRKRVKKWEGLSTCLVGSIWRRLILEAIDDNKLSQIGNDLGKRAFKEFLFLWFKKRDVEKVLEGISLWCKYAGLAEYDLETDGRNYTITLHHEIGEKWSNLIGHLISQGIKTELSLPNTKLDFTDSLIIIKFFVPWQ